MESRLTRLEMDAVAQLIQLSSGDSAPDFHVLWLELEIKENREAESVGVVINPEKFLEEALPRRRKRLLPIADIYRNTKPLITNRTLKTSKF
ncbi:hypothetical protein SASPL_104634 [Salvia splendens]|uniref:Uncharacterized protein n=1 Tax=Salvia splendens TaxID=180675 RepID=A0A8X8YK97_SALSN|nr:hypothetical protein SASPL_104634 [Salvia splendens]